MKITLNEPPKGFSKDAEFRTPKKGETFIDIYGDIISTVDAPTFHCPRIILKKEYEWPPWCKAWGWCMDKDGSLFLYTSPANIILANGSWCSNGCLLMSERAMRVLCDLPIPKIEDWTQPILNPYYKAE